MWQSLTMGEGLNPALVYTGEIDSKQLAGVDHVPMQIKGRPSLVFPHSYETWVKLRQLGYDPPSPMEKYYNWPGIYTPRESQKITSIFFTYHNRCFCLNGLGTGKTYSAIWGLDYLRREGLIRRVLVVAPKTTRYLVWVSEFFRSTVKAVVRVAEGDRDQKREVASNLNYDVVVVNPESLHLIEHFLPDVDLVVVDEFTKFKTKNTRRYRALEKIVGKADDPKRGLWMMSATPAPQSPMDAYGPCKLVNPAFPYTKTEWQLSTMFRTSKYNWVPRPGATDFIFKFMRPSVRFTREECYDLPPVQYINLDVEMTGGQKTALAQLEDQGMALVEGERITATNAGAIFTKAQQIINGFIYNRDKEPKFLPNRPMEEAVLDLVNSSPDPVLVFASFPPAVKKFHEFLTKHGVRSRMVYGGIKQGERDEAFREFYDGTLDAIVAVASTMSHGLNQLVTGNVIIWTVAPTSFEVYKQAIGRMDRSGQQKPVVVYQLVNSAMGKKLFSRQATREKLQQSLLDLFGKGGTNVQT